MTGTDIPRDGSGRVIRPKPSQLLADVMDALGPDHMTTRTLMAALIERDRGEGAEPRAVSPIWGLHIPVLSDTPNVPYDMQELALDVEGMDTGWRNISGTFLNGWTGVVGIRRTGYEVHLSAYNLVVPAVFAGVILNIPAGFKADIYPAQAAVFLTAGQPTTLTAIMSSTAHHLTLAGTPPAGGSSLRFSLPWPCSEEWPGALPGTPGLVGGRASSKPADGGR